MRKLTHKEKKNKVRTLSSWIGRINSRLTFIENIDEYVKRNIDETNVSLKKENIISYFNRWIEEPSSFVIPMYINDFKLEQSNFKTIESIDSYIEKIDNIASTYSGSDTLVGNQIEFDLYFRRYLSLLQSRASYEREAMIDYSPEVTKIKSTLVKHEKSLENLDNKKTYTISQINKGIKQKEDHSERIKKVTKEIENKFNTLKLHIENLYQNRKGKKRLEKFMRGESEYEIYTINWEEYTVETITEDALIPFAQKEKKRKVWIKKTISNIRTLKDKLNKYQHEFDEYLIESGSIGEKIVRQWLINKNIEFEEQKRFSDCIDKSTLPFDFFLPTLKILIEFDGAQHYMAIELFGGEVGFIDRKRKDAIKTKWAEK
ncbi:hypothetical protein [Sulfurimonas autotrophica]|nr:hypothetical protein [Sulfurimonas autotrophica]